MSFEDTFQLRNEIICSTIEFKICPSLWVDNEYISENINLEDIEEIKYLDSSGTVFSESVESLPTNGGLYFFMIKSKTFSEVANYLVYIGRAKKTDNHNLKVRCKKYLQNYANDRERPKISTMIHKYGKYLYLKYIDLGDDNDLIDDLEEKLINNLLPPFNSQIPKKEIREAVAAF
ncbi:hypothetical protein ACOJTA_13065 [Malaciobacter sp. WC5094]